MTYMLEIVLLCLLILLVITITGLAINQHINICARLDWLEREVRHAKLQTCSRSAKRDIDGAER